MSRRSAPATSPACRCTRRPGSSQNMADVERGAGLWNTALPIANAMSFHDDKRCKTFTEIIVTEGGTPYVIGTRLYLHEGKIIRVDSLVTKTGRLAVQRQRLSQVHQAGGLGAAAQVPADRARRDDPRRQCLSRRVQRQVHRHPVGHAVRAARRRRLHQPRQQARRELRGRHPGGRALHRQPRLPDRRGEGRDQRVLPLRQLDRRAGFAHLPLHRRQDPRRSTRSAC